MTDLASLLAAPGLDLTAYPPSSRYFGLKPLTLTAADGSTTVYLARRFVPSPQVYTPMATHMVASQDRPDTLAAAYFGDPTQYWLIADANAVLRPADLTQTPGRRLVIGLRPPGGGT
jgi:hypothetical protein